jgi:hypothetical protein
LAQAGVHRAKAPFAAIERRMQAVEPGAVFRRQFLARPEHSSHRRRVEPADVDATQCGSIVVAHQAQRVLSAQQLAALVGVRTITDHVPQTQHAVVLSASRLQHSLQTEAVAMNVRYKKKTHELTLKLSLGDSPLSIRVLVLRMGLATVTPETENPSLRACEILHKKRL